MFYWEKLKNLSKNKNLKDCIKEWIYTWNIADAWKNSYSNCEVCWTQIRYMFEIENILNKNKLFTWCECIKNFDISVLDSLWNRLNKDETKVKLNSDKNNYIKEANKLDVINTLTKLSNISEDEMFDFKKFIWYYSEHDYFSPRQILCIELNLNKYKLCYNPQSFKIWLKKKKDIDNFKSLPWWQKQKIKPFLTKKQISRYWI